MPKPATTKEKLMLIRVTFKTPDAIDYAIEDFEEEQKEDAKDFLETFVRNGEYITIEFDTVMRTAVALSNAALTQG